MKKKELEDRLRELELKVEQLIARQPKQETQMGAGGWGGSRCPRCNGQLFTNLPHYC